MTDPAVDIYGCIITGNELGQLQVIKRVAPQASAEDKGNQKSRNEPKAASTSGWTVVQTWGEADRSAGVTCIDVAYNILGGVPNEAVVLVGRKNGGIDVLRLDRTTCVLDTSNVSSRRKDDSTFKKDELKAIVSIHAMKLPGVPDFTVIVLERGGQVRFFEPTLTLECGSFSCPKNVTCAAYDSDKHLAVGCQGAELRVYSISLEEDGDFRGALMYAAKGGKPDEVGFCDKPWNTSVSFDPFDPYGLIVATGHGKLRLYKISVGRRPQLNTPFKEHRITTVAPDPKEKIWWVADAGGNLQSYDVQAAKFSGAIKGIGGSVRAVDVHPSLPVIVSGGLDRYVRVHSTRTRKSVAKLYMTAQVNVVKWIVGPPGEKQKEKKNTKKRKAA